MLAALIGATEFTVWNQSVVNEKVYTVSLMGLAIISWLTVRWSDDPDGPQADRLLVHDRVSPRARLLEPHDGLSRGPGSRRRRRRAAPSDLSRWKLIAVSVGALLLGMTPFLTQPIRAAHFPAINEGEPTDVERAFLYNFNRGQYGKPALTDRQAPFAGQLGMFWLYFKWQWLRDAKSTLSARAVDSRRDLHDPRTSWAGTCTSSATGKSFWYFGTFMLTLTLVLIYYLNFKYGALAVPGDGELLGRGLRGTRSRLLLHRRILRLGRVGGTRPRLHLGRDRVALRQRRGESRAAR